MVIVEDFHMVKEEEIRKEIGMVLEMVECLETFKEDVVTVILGMVVLAKCKCVLDLANATAICRICFKQKPNIL